MEVTAISHKGQEKTGAVEVTGISHKGQEKTGAVEVTAISHKGQNIPTLMAYSNLTCWVM